MSGRAVRLRRTDALARVGRLDEAREQLLDYVSGAPDDWSAVEAAADLCERTGQLRESVRLRLGMARHFARGGALARAAETYEAVLRIAPSDVCAAFRLAELVAARGDHDRTRTLLAGMVPDPAAGTPVVPAGRLADVCADLVADRLERGRAGLVRLIANARGVAPEVTAAWLEAARRVPEPGVTLALAVADACLVAGDAEAAIAALRGYLEQGAGRGAATAWARIVEVAIESGRGGVAIDAQAELAEALAAEGRLDEAERVARDLATRLPDGANQARLARVSAARAAASTPQTDPMPGPDSHQDRTSSLVTGLIRDLSDALDELGPR